jgi:hypothetical protein
VPDREIPDKGDKVNTSLVAHQERVGADEQEPVVQHQTVSSSSEGKNFFYFGPHNKT